jgi:four helix bundle protein
MKIQKFEDLIAWQKAQILALQIYKTYASLKDWGFKDQIQRASVSVSNNIAEGFGRNSLLEYIRLLYIAHASCNEVKSKIYLSLGLNYISEETQKELIEMCNEEGRIINGLISSLQKLKPNS